MVSDQEWNEFIEWWEDRALHHGVDALELLRVLYRWYASRWVLDVLNIIGGTKMARGTGKAKKAATKALPYSTEFVNISVETVTREDINEAYPTSEVVWEKFDHALRTGHKFSWSYNAQSDSIIVSITGRGDDCVNDGRTMSSFAGDWYTALLVSLYKHYQICDENWGESDAAQRPSFG